MEHVAQRKGWRLFQTEGPMKEKVGRLSAGDWRVHDGVYMQLVQ